jgi:signal transduction histidine kinase
LVAGVASGISRSWRLETSLVRFAFLALSVAGGFGALLYVALWLLLPLDLDDDGSFEEPRRDRREGIALLVATAGALLLLRSAGLWFTDEAALLGLAVAGGLALVWGRADGRAALAAGGSSVVRIVVGALLVAAGFGVLVVRGGDLEVLARSLVAALAAAAGVALLVGPRVVRLADDLAAERRARVRSEERSEIAAHLHDGVLQTLALIQKRAGDNREVAALARRQERELRSWLYEGAPADPASLAATLRAELATVEDDHQVRVELVCVGDAPLDDAVRALVAATKEAATNAARHAGVGVLDVYVEVEDDAVEAYVRDRGRGFDRAVVPADRRGLVESIEGRMQRAGGTAEVRSRPGEGAEVRLRVPRDRA